MKINIQSIGLTPREELSELIQEKLNKLEKLSDRIVDARVVLKIEKADNRENKTIEIRLGLPGKDLYVSKQGTAFEEIVQKATDTLARELKDWKETH